MVGAVETFYFGSLVFGAIFGQPMIVRESAHEGVEVAGSVVITDD